MNSKPISLTNTITKDAMSGIIVFLVALPLCLGIALASGAPLFSGLVAGIVGGIVIGVLSGSHTSVSGPAAGLTAIVAAQIATLGSFPSFLLAVVIAGVLQIILGIVKAGSLSAFFPSSVIKGLLAAIGTILIIKQLPYLLGYDMVPKGPSHGHSTIVTQIMKIFTGQVHAGALIIGLISLVVLVIWDNVKLLKKSLVPAPLVVVLIGVAIGIAFQSMGGSIALAQRERFMVNVPVSESIVGFLGFLNLPDFSQWANPAIYVSAVTLAIVASLETLLNLDAVDKLDKKQRLSPPSRELWAQGVGNIACGMLGGLPVTSVIIRGSVNVNSGAETRLSAIIHGMLLLVCVMFVPYLLNMIPLSCLAAILLMTGFKLASPKLLVSTYREGWPQFLPFVITVVAIVSTDLLIGISIGMFVSLLFILASSLSVPVRQIIEKHVGGEIRHIELANQVSFLNRAALERTLRSAPSGSQILLDARRTNYIDPDILSLIREFKDVTAPALEVQLSLRGFREKYGLDDDIQYVDYTTRELQSQLTPTNVLQLLKDGNTRFRTGNRLDRDLSAATQDNISKESPMAVIFSGIDPRTPAEIIFDLGLGDLYSIRSAGSIISSNSIGSMEYGCVVGGAKLIVLLGHSHSGLVDFAVRQSCSEPTHEALSNCPSLVNVLAEIQGSISQDVCRAFASSESSRRNLIIDEISQHNVQTGVKQIVSKSPAIRQLVDSGKLAIVSGMFNIESGKVEFFEQT
jgi:carbonic anhydrase